MNYFTSKTAEQLTLVSISHAREGKPRIKKACLDLIEKAVRIRKKELSVTICMKIGTPLSIHFS